MEAETLVHGPRMWAGSWFRGGCDIKRPSRCRNPVLIPQQLTERSECWRHFPKLKSLGHICQQPPANLCDLKDFHLGSQCSSWRTSQGLKFYKGQTPGKGLCRLSAFFFGNLATHIYLFNVWLHLYPPIPLMLIFLMELLFWEYMLFIAGWKIRRTGFILILLLIKLIM